MYKLDVSIKELRKIAEKYENTRLSNMDFLGIPMPTIDCNKCQYISITETAQRKEKTLSRIYANVTEKDVIIIAERKMLFRFILAESAKKINLGIILSV